MGKGTLRPVSATISIDEGICGSAISHVISNPIGSRSGGRLANAPGGDASTAMLSVEWRSPSTGPNRDTEAEFLAVAQKVGVISGEQQGDLRFQVRLDYGIRCVEVLCRVEDKPFNI